uniref:Large ribosomal subunit protein uL30m n=1 Tax=Moina brachiata TaxID=675436 RepID=A0A4Y7NJA4_9CRUS|nr:EOG090X0EYV [Moina brachiata]SVE93300.1 EOG090X0EYV [Moina brachiata]
MCGRLDQVKRIGGNGIGHPDHKEPPYEPSKALMVQRIRCLKKKPYWEKNVLIEIGLDGKNSEIAILPNTPSTCAMLWKVKHLVRITPISLPQGLPEDGDLTGARLLENGQLTFVPRLGVSASNPNQHTIADLKSRPEHMDGETLRKILRLKWLKPHD